MSMKSGSKFFVRNLITTHPTHIHRYVLCDFLIKEFWHYLQFIPFVLFPLLKKNVLIFISLLLCQAKTKQCISLVKQSCVW